MSTQIIAQSERFTLASHYNGIAYTLTDTANARDIFVQGESAETFRKQFDGIAARRDAESAFAIMWDLYSDSSEEA